MKIWCENCDGTGEVDNSTRFEKDSKKCSECKGKGYNKIDLDLQEMARHARIGLATIDALNNHMFIGEHASIVDEDTRYKPKFYSVENLLDWAEEKDEYNAMKENSILESESLNE